MPSTTLVYSFPGPLGRRGAVALAVGALHIVLATALVAGLAITGVHERERPIRIEFVTPRTAHPPAPVHPLAPRPDEFHRSLDRPDERPVDLTPSGPTPTRVELPAGTATTPAGDGPQIVTPARVLHAEQPPYPAAARRLGEEGTVIVRVHVDALGRPEQVELGQSSGSPRLDDAALRAVARWRFAPARRGGDALDAWLSLKVTFRLTG